MRDALPGAGWSVETSVEGGDVFVKGRWRVMPLQSEPFNQIMMMCFDSQEACRKFDPRHLDTEVATELYMAYSLDAALALLEMADPQVARRP
jgi:hypothetical protein